MPVPRNMWVVKKTCAKDLRRSGRLRVELLSCKLGHVLDMSATGMRVRRRGRQLVSKGDKVQVTLKSLLGQQTVKAEVMWIKKLGFLRYEFGLRFVDITPEESAALIQIAQISVDGRAIYGDKRVGDIEEV
jgi:hypothetical protein